MAVDVLPRPQGGPDLTAPPPSDKMVVLHADLANPHPVWTAAQSVFELRQGGSP